MQTAPNTAAVQTLPKEKLAELFTVGAISIRKGTDAEDFNSDGTQDGFRVLLRTNTAEGQVLPATGTLTIEAFDIAAAKDAIAVGKWTFTPAQLKAAWIDGFGLYHFGLNCPWTRRPEHDAIRFKATFVEALTGNAFVDEQTFTVHYRGPTTQAAPAAADQ
jgi:hypothetical protein